MKIFIITLAIGIVVQSSFAGNSCIEQFEEHFKKIYLGCQMTLEGKEVPGIADLSFGRQKVFYPGQEVIKKIQFAALTKNGVTIGFGGISPEPVMAISCESEMLNYRSKSDQRRHGQVLVIGAGIQITSNVPEAGRYLIKCESSKSR